MPDFKVTLVLLSVLVYPAEAYSKCFGELGCFDDGGVFYHPLYRPLNLLPEEREAVGVAFLIFTRRNPDHEDKLSWSCTLEQVRRSHFNSSWQTKMIIYGWLDTLFFATWVQEMKKAFLLKADYNVIVVDWSGGNGLPYTQAAANARLAGAEVALFVRKLEKAFGVDPMSIHVLGHSLGSHVAGYAGERIKKLGRITGLDPAEPYFEKMPPQVRLDPTDADFVEVVHTDGSSVIPGLLVGRGLGMYAPSGHLDFYPNGGILMPGCNVGSGIKKLFIEGLVEGARTIVSCHHQKATDYYLDTIRDDRCLPVAYSCPSHDQFNRGWCSDCGRDGSKCAPFGHHADRWRRFKNDSQSVRMFLNTNTGRPFCLFHYLVHVQIAKDPRAQKVSGYLQLTLHGSQGTVTLSINTQKADLWPGARYTFMTTTPSRVGNIEKVSFVYRSWTLFFWRKLYLRDVEMRTMNIPVLRSRRSVATAKMCPKDADGISSGRRVYLMPC